MNPINQDVVAPPDGSGKIIRARGDEIGPLPNNSTLILPLSMSKLQNSQGPQATYDVVLSFLTANPERALKIVILYTDGLYCNNGKESAFSVHRRTVAQMLGHQNAFRRIEATKGHALVESGVLECVSWNHLLLGVARTFQKCVEILERRIATDPIFSALVHAEVQEHDRATLAFLLEELVMVHLIREQDPGLPWMPPESRGPQLIAYHGTYSNADVYQWQHQILPRNKKCSNPFRASQVDLKRGLIFDFNISIGSAAPLRDGKAPNGDSESGHLPRGRDDHEGRIASVTTATEERK